MLFLFPFSVGSAVEEEPGGGFPYSAHVLLLYSTPGVAVVLRVLLISFALCKSPQLLLSPFQPLSFMQLLLQPSPVYVWIFKLLLIVLMKYSFFLTIKPSVILVFIQTCVVSDSNLKHRG